MSLKHKAFSAGRWTTTSAFVRIALQILQTVILARLLTPADFGLMAVTAALLAVIGLFADLGLNRAIIHYEQISDDALSSLYWLNIGMSAGLTLIFAAIAPLLGTLYRQPALTAVLFTASPVFLLSAIGQQFCVLAEKELRFATLASNEIIASVVGFAVAVSIALRGGGVYALIGAVLATAATVSLLAWWRLSDGHRPHLHVRLAEARPFLRYGAYLMGESFGSTMVRQVDVFVGGLVASPAALGVYSVPRDLSLRVAMIVNPIITRVSFPVMARLQGDMTALKSVYLQTLRMTASANFPVYIALALFANEIVALLYGPHWHDSVEYLRIFAVWGLLRSVGNPVGSLLYAVGRARLAFWWTIIVLVAIVPLLWLGAQFGGLQGLAWTMVGLQMLIFVPSWRYLVRPCCGANFAEFIAIVLLPLALALASGMVAYGAVWLGDITGILRLIVGGCVGGLAYISLSLIFNRPWTNAMYELIGRPLHLPRTQA